MLSSVDVTSKPCSASMSTTTTSTARTGPSSSAHRLRRARLLPSSVTSTSTRWKSVPRAPRR
jgi:hypothetical protein